MAFSLTWLSDVLQAADLKVAEQPGWPTRGRGDIGPVRGVMCHHTAGPRAGNMPSLGVITHGRGDLPGPLAQLGLGRDGTFYVIAAGRANHAGRGRWRGLATGNSSFIGIEAENTGGPDDPWPQAQLDAYRRGVAALLVKIGADAGMCCGHKEYALPPGRKTDPSFDMAAFRADVQVLLNGGGAPPSLIPAHDEQDRPTLRRGDAGQLVERVQRDLGLPPSGAFDAVTEAAVRAFQRRAPGGLVPDGIIGPRTWAALDGKP
jgi:peptidoglycan hydrolase-like protein with peptidoglycan-binding domain